MYAPSKEKLREAEVLLVRKMGNPSAAKSEVQTSESDVGGEKLMLGSFPYTKGPTDHTERGRRKQHEASDAASS